MTASQASMIGGSRLVSNLARLDRLHLPPSRCPRTLAQGAP